MAQKKSKRRPSPAKSAARKPARQGFIPPQSRQQAEKVVQLGNDAVKDFLATSADEAQKTQEKLYSISREGAQNIAKSADAVSRLMYDGLSISRDNIETCIECGNIAAALAKDVSAEVFENANRAFSGNVELSKEAFACRTINDMMELNNRAFRHAVDNFFSQSARLSNMVFEYTSEALEPINERVSEATEQFSKTLAA